MEYRPEECQQHEERFRREEENEKGDSRPKAKEKVGEECKGGHCFDVRDLLPRPPRSEKKSCEIGKLNRVSHTEGIGAAGFCSYVGLLGPV